MAVWDKRHLNTDIETLLLSKHTLNDSWLAWVCHFLSVFLSLSLSLSFFLRLLKKITKASKPQKPYNYHCPRIFPVPLPLHKFPLEFCLYSPVRVSTYNGTAWRRLSPLHLFSSMTVPEFHPECLLFRVTCSPICLNLGSSFSRESRVHMLLFHIRQRLKHKGGWRELTLGDGKFGTESQEKAMSSVRALGT